MARINPSRFFCMLRILYGVYYTSGILYKGTATGILYGKIFVKISQKVLDKQ